MSSELIICLNIKFKNRSDKSMKPTTNISQYWANQIYELRYILNFEFFSLGSWIPKKLIFVISDILDFIIIFTIHWSYMKPFTIKQEIE